jgi:hypothetical protein
MEIKARQFWWNEDGKIIKTKKIMILLCTGEPTPQFDIELGIDKENGLNRSIDFEASDILNALVIDELKKKEKKK